MDVTHLTLLITVSGKLKALLINPWLNSANWKTKPGSLCHGAATQHSTHVLNSLMWTKYTIIHIEHNILYTIKSFTNQLVVPTVILLLDVIKY